MALFLGTDKERVVLLQNKCLELNVSEFQLKEMFSDHFRMMFFLTPRDYNTYINVVIDKFIESGSCDLK